MKFISYLLTSFFILFTFKSYSAPYRDCELNEKWLSNAEKKMTKQSFKRDVQKLADSMIEVLSFSCPTNTQYQAIKRLKRAIKVGLYNQIKFMKKEARNVSAYRAPDLEFKAIKKAQLTLKNTFLTKNTPKGLSEIEIRKLTKLGALNSKKRKQNCQNIDNRKYPLIEKKSKRNKMRDQDSIGWCYAYAAADLIGHKTGIEVSAVDIANSYNQKTKNGLWDRIIKKRASDKEGGLIETAIELAITSGLCLESDLPSSDFQFSGLTTTYHKELQSIENLFNKHRQQQNQLANSDSNQRNFACHMLGTNLSKLFPLIQLKNILPIIETLSTDQDFIHQLVQQSCTRRVQTGKKLEVVKINSKSFESKDKLIRELDKQLNSGNIAAIGYYSAIFNDLYDRSSRPHASSIVARKFDQTTSSCKYLIRNSWGSGCEQYDSPQLKCEDGNIWVSEEHLRPSLFQLVYVQ